MRNFILLAVICGFTFTSACQDDDVKKITNYVSSLQLTTTVDICSLLPTICCMKEIYDTCKDDKVIGTKIQQYDSAYLYRLISQYTTSKMVDCGGTSIYLDSIYSSLTSCKCSATTGSTSGTGTSLNTAGSTTKTAPTASTAAPTRSTNVAGSTKTAGTTNTAAPTRSTNVAGSTKTAGTTNTAAPTRSTNVAGSTKTAGTTNTAAPTRSTNVAGSTKTAGTMNTAAPTRSTNVAGSTKTAGTTNTAGSTNTAGTTNTAGSTKTNGTSATSGTGSTSTSTYTRTIVETCDNIKKYVSSFHKCQGSVQHKNMSKPATEAKAKEFVMDMCSSYTPGIIRCMKNSYSSCNESIKIDIARRGDIYNKVFCDGTKPYQNLLDAIPATVKAVSTDKGDCALGVSDALSGLYKRCSLLAISTIDLTSAGFTSRKYQDALQTVARLYDKFYSCINMELSNMKCSDHVKTGILYISKVKTLMFGMHSKNVQTLIKPLAVLYRSPRRTNVLMYGLSHVKALKQNFQRCQFPVGEQVLFDNGVFKITGMADKVKAGEESLAIRSVSLSVKGKKIYEASVKSLQAAFTTGKTTFDFNGNTLTLLKISDRLVRCTCKDKGFVVFIGIIKKADAVSVVTIRGSESMMDNAKGLLVDGCTNVVAPKTTSNTAVSRRKRATKVECETSCQGKYSTMCAEDCDITGFTEWGQAANDLETSETEAAKQDEYMSDQNEANRSCVASLAMIIMMLLFHFK